MPTRETARATVRTPLSGPAVVAAAVRPDNTPQLETTVADGAVRTTIDRDDAGGLRSTFDDYAVNLSVAATVARLAARHDAQLAGQHGEQRADQYADQHPTDTNDTQ